LDKIILYYKILIRTNKYWKKFRCSERQLFGRQVPPASNEVTIVSGHTLFYAARGVKQIARGVSLSSSDSGMLHRHSLTLRILITASW